MKYLIANVYRPADGHDCTLDGVSSKFNQVAVPCEYGPYTEEECVRLGVPVMEIRANLPGSNHLRPKGVKGWVMFGGNYAASSDSRFPNDYPLPIHDRIESY